MKSWRVRPWSAVSSVGGMLVVASLAASPPRAQSQTPADTLQPWHAVMYRSVLSATVSPDGRQAAFLRTNPRRPLADDSGRTWVELWVWDAEGEEVPFVTGEVNVAQPRWIGNEALGFLARRDGDDQRAFYRIATSGGEAVKVFEHETSIGAYDISADGRWLAFLATDEVDADQETLADKGFNQRIFEEQLRFTRLWLSDLESGERPDNRETRMVELEGSVRSVRFSPDGQRLLVAVTPTPLVDDSYVAERFQVVDREGRVTGRIDTAGKLGPAVWSPDGQHIALIASVDRNTRPRGG